jgi:hypothetical protein
MRSVPKVTASPTAVAWALLLLALLWYWSFWILFSSDGNYLSHVPWPWLLVSAFAPAATLALAFAMYRALRDSGRSIRLHEILIVVVVTPQFLGWGYVWWGLLYYMGAFL